MISRPFEFARRLRQSANAALGFLYPEICQYCREQWAEPAQGFICADCAGQVRLIRPPFCERCGLPYAGDITGRFHCANCGDQELHFSSGRAAVAAEGMMLDLIHRWKYQGALWLEPFLLPLFVREASAALAAGEWDGVVPVPLHPLREREREFNQAEHLARALATALRLPLMAGEVRRVEATRTQTKLTRGERDDNMRRAFALAAGGAAVLRGKRVILVDDVLTTGSTTSACARVMREAGARDVCVWTLARGLLH